MSGPQDIDEPLFQFDLYEVPGSSRSIDSTPSQGGNLEEGRSTDVFCHDLSTHKDVNQQAELSLETDGKGKEVPMPLPIQAPSTVGRFHDLFDLLPSASATIHTQTDSNFGSPLSSPTQSPFNFYSIAVDDTQQHPGLFAHDDSMRFLRSPITGTCSDNAIEPDLEKGKNKETELPPVLPPLTFSPTEFVYDDAGWPSPRPVPSTPGPSSYGSGYGSVAVANSQSIPQSSSVAQAVSPPNLTGSFPTLNRVPSRRRSLSNLSVHSARSFTGRSMFRVKGRLGTSRIQSNLARKLLFRKRDDVSNSPASDTTIMPPTGSRIIDSGDDVSQGNCFMPWRVDIKSTIPSDDPLSYLNLDIGLNAEPQILPFSRTFLKGKSRSDSSPLPFSTLDYVPITSPDIFAPIPLVIRNYFDDILPKELRLHILFDLVALHQADHARAVSNGHWSFAKATSSKSKWVGKDKGLRELVKLRRVSKAWQRLVFDGQLWTDLDLHSFRTMPKSLILRIAETGGSFIRSLDVSGHVHLLSGTLLDITDNLCSKPVPLGSVPYTQLTTINLQGCTALTTRSLHHLLMRSRSLRNLTLKGLGVVTNTTCDVLAVYCQQLTTLNMSRCMNMDADGIRCLAAATIARGEHLKLKELRLSGLKHVSDTMMATLGKAAPYLEVLDLSYVRQLHNSALDAFVSCEEGEVGLGVETIRLTAREAGRDSNDSNYYWRRVTRLRHLSVSSCVLLTDVACSNLAYCLPHLEFLEMASIGAELKDDGLIKLLRTTPLIRRLDLEDASDISDSVITAITPTSAFNPSAESTEPSNMPAAQELVPGHALERLIISYASNVTDDALLALIRSCTRLTVLEVDNTRIGADVLREFVQLSRNRQMVDSEIVAIDCRGIGEGVVKDLSGSTRPRKGWRAYDAKKLRYLDGRDDVVEDLKVGQDECDEKRVVLKTFYSWQTVDVVRAAREKRRKSTSRRAANESSGSLTDSDEFSGRVTRWWSPGTRRSGAGSPTVMSDNDGCRIM